VSRALLVIVLLLLAGPAAAQRAQTVRLTSTRGGTVFRFTPERLTVRPGDVLEFRAEAGAPYVVAFEPADLDTRSRNLLAAALAHPDGELRGPVLADSGSRFRLTVPALRPGTYRFFSLTHRAYRMAGVLVVK
jgi:plastocyanin